MDSITRANLDALQSDDKVLQNAAFFAILEATSQPVDWSYDAWDTLLAELSHRDNRRRAIAAQALCNLAKSDPENRMLSDFPTLLAVTKDERFVTARHCLQAIWKVGVAGDAQRQLVVDGLSRRFAECVHEKNGTLIRYDIVQGLRNLYDAVGDEAIQERALQLIETEEDAKYRKKYAGVWRTV
jgi:hypothetical protein